MIKKIFKAGILMMLLVIPAFVFIFLKIFGENQFSLPFYIPETDSNGSIQVIKGDTSYYTLPNLQLIDSSEVGFNLYSLNSRIKVLYFDNYGNDSLSSISGFNIDRVSANFNNIRQLSFLTLVDSTCFFGSKVTRASSGYAQIGWDRAYCNDYVFNVLSKKVFGLTFLKDKSVTIETLVMKNNVVLIDDKYKIRGIYNSLDVNEIDRLKLEIKVLKDILDIE
jgi:protein SCO1/2